MKKRVLAMFLCFMMLVPFVPRVLAAEIPQTLETPLNLNVRYDGTALLCWTEPESITKLYTMGPDKTNDDVFAKMDVKIDNGPWRSETDPLTPEKDLYRDPFMLYVRNQRRDINNVLHDVFIPTRNIDENFDYENKTYYFRVRYLIRYSEGGIYKFKTGPFSEIAAFGKNAPTVLPETLEAPPKPKAELLTKSNGEPYFSLEWDIPESVAKANQKIAISAFIDWKIGDGKWASESGKNLHSTGSQLANKTEIYPQNTGDFGEINIEANIYSFRVCFQYSDGKKTVKSPFSIPVSIGTPAYQSASSWAVPELDQAAELGFITDSIKEKMNDLITREEFAEVAVNFYEIVTGKKAEPHPTKTFKDTTNPVVLKAFNLGITAGAGDGTVFEPKGRLIRQQMAAMITRTLTAVFPVSSIWLGVCAAVFSLTLLTESLCQK